MLKMVLNKVGFYLLSYLLFTWIAYLLGFGCHIGQYFVGGVGFADDLKLLAPSNKGLQNLVYICEDYAHEFDITFNGAKSKFLVFDVSNSKVVTNPKSL